MWNHLIQFNYYKKISAVNPWNYRVKIAETINAFKNETKLPFPIFYMLVFKYVSAKVSHVFYNSSCKVCQWQQLYGRIP